MKRTVSSLFAIAALSVTLAVPAAQAAQPDTRDVTKLFVDGGVAVDRLQAVEVGGILILRGRTEDPERAAAASRFAQSLGYARVANLVQVTQPADDANIARKVERELTIHRGLDGCNFRVASTGGVVRIAGRINNELQRDMAIQLVRNVDGVRAVQADELQR